MIDQPPAVTTAVAIVGAGPSGLSLAIELGSRGVSCILFERNDRVGYAPRAKTTNVRTRTHLRRWGIADRLAAEAPFGIDYPSDVHFVTRLGGHHLTTIPNASNCSPARCDDYPEHGQWIPQYKLEEVLRAHAARLPSVSLRFGCELLHATQDADGVELMVATPDGEQRIRAAYLVGADGARSRVRDIVGARMTGTHGLSRNYNIIFRAPGLSTAHPHGPGTMYWQLNGNWPSLVGPMDAGDIWFLMPTRLPDGVDLHGDGMADVIRDAIGIDVPIEVLSADQWVASSLIADRYRDRRMFLIGDACHLHPPFGGYGMNMGVADAVDLGWKLAAVLDRWGGPGLLDSYEAERRKIHAEVLAEASANHAVLSNDLWSEDLERADDVEDLARQSVATRIHAAKEREFYTLGTVLGGRYGSSPIIVPDDDDGVESGSSQYRPSSRPGALAPHCWIGDRSLYDHFGSGFTMLCKPGVQADVIATITRDAARERLPLCVVTLPQEAAGRYARAFTLIRPDQYVAWRGNAWAPDVLTAVTGWHASSEGLSASPGEQRRQALD